METQRPYGGGNTPPTSPALLTGNGHSIPFFKSPSRYPFLREVEPVANYVLKHNLPNVNRWQAYGELVGIERPGHVDELGTTRCWFFADTDLSGVPEPQQALCIQPASIRPGLPSRPYKAQTPA